MNIKEIAKQNNLSQTDLTILNEISNRMFKGYYKIPIYEDSVPIEVHQKVKDENTRLKTILETILNTAKQV